LNNTGQDNDKPQTVEHPYPNTNQEDSMPLQPPDNTPEVRGAFTIVTVARALNVSRTTVWDWIKQDRLESFRLTDSPKSPYRIPRSALLAAYPGPAGQDLVAHCDRIASSRKS
jgi:excisionase family DNA binding protein